jgi:DNA-binding NarL/FixJ family response regulator
MSSPAEQNGSGDSRGIANALSESAEQLGEMGSWEWIAETDELIWSDNHFRLYGLEPNEISPSLEFVTEQTHPEDRERMAREVEDSRAGGGSKRVEYRIVRWDREVRYHRSTVTEIEANPRRVIGYVQDVTERRLAERELQAHIAVADALGGWESLDQSGGNLLCALGEAMGFVAGAVWVPEAGFLHPRVFWQKDSVDAKELKLMMRGRRLARGCGLPGQTWASRQPTALGHSAADLSSDLLRLMALAGWHGAVAFPALAEEDVLAVVKLYSQEDFALTDRLMQSFSGIGRELGHFLDRRRVDLGAPVLTPRELEVLQLAARGHSAPEIAKSLVLSHDTVKTHFRHVYSRLDVHDRATAVAQALRFGLIE